LLEKILRQQLYQFTNFLITSLLINSVIESNNIIESNCNTCRNNTPFKNPLWENTL